MAALLGLVAAETFSQSPAEAAWSYIAVAEPYSTPKDAVVVTADVLGTGRPQIVIGSGTELSVIRFDTGAGTGGFVPSEPIRLGGTEPVAPISSIVPLDLNGDGRDELAIGTTGAGSVSLFQVTEWTPSDGGPSELRLDALSQLGYMWQEIVQLEAADVTGDGFVDLLAMTGSGEMTLFTYDVKESPHIFSYSPTWTGKPPGDRPWERAETIDWNGDGDTELVLSTAEDHIGIYDWTGSGWSSVWENYPWGRLTYVSAWPGDVSSSLTVVTSQRILYNYDWASGEFGLAFNTHEPLLVGSAFLTLTAPPPANLIGGEAVRPDAPRLMVAGRAGLISFRVAGGQFALESNTGFLPDVRALFNLSDGRLAALTTAGDLWVLTPVPDDYLQLEVNGRPTDVWRSPIVLQTDLYIDVLDVPPLLANVDWDWDSRSGRLEMRRADNRVELRAGEHVAVWNGVAQVMPAPVRVVGTRAYVPANVMLYLGATVTWEAPYRRLTVTKEDVWNWLGGR